MNLIINVFIMVLCFIFSFPIREINLIQKYSSWYSNQIQISNYSENDSSLPCMKTYINDLVLISSLPNDMILDIRYASKNNFTGVVLYDADIGVLHKETFKKLLRAHEEFKSLGYKIKIWDAYRPFYVQKIL